MHENLIDQTHFPFLHPGTVGTPEYARSKLTASTEDNQVVIRRELKNAAPPGVYGKPANIMHKRVDRTSEARFVSPAMHTAFASIRVVDPDPGRPTLYRFNITHAFTPETNNSIHYWWFVSRDYRPAIPRSTTSWSRPTRKHTTRMSKRSNGSMKSSATTANCNST
jgi:phenylpropionate dioxygenase-like ring-hydroxylating dioxygenase large terminal subunit